MNLCWKLYASLLQTVRFPRLKTRDNEQNSKNDSSMGGARQYNQIQVFLQYLKTKMKSNKGITTTISSLAEFILQQRMDFTPKSTILLDHIQQELLLLKDELLPSMEIFHFLVDKANYNVKHKISQALKNTPFQNLLLSIKIKLHDKVNNFTHIAQLWKITVKTIQGQSVPPEEAAHQLLFLLQQILNHLKQGPLFAHFIRNHEAHKKYILDFQFQLADQEKISASTPLELTRTWINHARIDNTRELLVSCHYDTRIAKMINLNKKSPYLSSGIKSNKINKSNSQSTCRDSSELIQTEVPIVRDRSLSEGQLQSPLFEIYDNELDVTILSSGSQQMNDNHQVCLDEEEEEDFELLIQESNKDTQFVRQNSALLQEWQKVLTIVLLQ